MLFCGIDVGTTGVKAVVFDEKGTPVAEAHRNYSIQVEPDGTRLLRGQEIWDKTREVFLSAAKDTQGTLAAVCVDSFGEAFVALDKYGSILCDPMLFTDRWGEKEYYKAEKKTCAAEIAEICGLPLSPTYSLSMVLYLKEQQPDIYDKIDRILLIQDFINYKLCGQIGADYSTACRTMFFDVRNCSWSVELIEKFGLDSRHYSPPVPMGTVIGNLHEALVREAGLNGEVKVVVGGHDQPVNAIGAGLNKGYAVCSMGTSECVTPIIGPMFPADFIAQKGIPAEPLWKKGLFCCMAYNVTSGLLIQWFVSTFSDEPEPSFSKFDRFVPPHPTAIMIQPYLMGSGTPYMDPAARLAMTGIDYGTTKYDIYRAVLEALCLDQELNLTVLREQGINVDHIIAVGGGSKSRPWLQIKADVLQIPVSTLTVKEAGALGCAILSAKAIGVYGSIEEAAQGMSHIKETVWPNPEHKSFYKEKFDLYRKLHDHVKEESYFAFRRHK
ncbi:MAG: FGGY family carbohydrate kinase [Clostridia bacterium]|nr:FGGY family carbohydrate kinase [Clostridia bacterium]